MRWPADRSLQEDLGLWHVAYVKPRHEKALARDCEWLKVSYYLPLYEKRVRRRDNNKPRKSVLPLFPGYFPFVDRDGGKQRICETNRIVSILEVPDQNGFVNDLTQIWQAVASGIAIGEIVTYTPGRPVRIKTGPLEGLVGVIEETRSRMRLLLNVEAMNVALSVELDCEDVEPLDESHSSSSTQTR